ncbi:UNVERIFIED_CONTAM: hypothetical protein NCL1_22135 [Trichonephila clavipes]
MLLNAAFRTTLSNDIVALHPELWLELRFRIMDDPICYELRYVREVLQPEVVPFLQGIHGAIFQQDNARPHDAKTVRDFCSAQHMQLLPLPAYSPNTSPVEHVRDLVGRRLASDPRPAALKDDFCCAYKQYGILFYKQTFKISLTPGQVV